MNEMRWSPKKYEAQPRSKVLRDLSSPHNNPWRSVIDAQRKTMEVMDRRVKQSEGIGSQYKKFFNDSPELMENFKTMLSKEKEP